MHVALSLIMLHQYLFFSSVTEQNLTTRTFWANSSGSTQPVGWGNLPQRRGSSHQCTSASAVLPSCKCPRGNSTRCSSISHILQARRRDWGASRLSTQELGLLLTCMSANFRSVLTSSSCRTYYYCLPTNTQNSLQFKSFKHGNSNNDILIAFAALKFVEI